MLADSFLYLMTTDAEVIKKETDIEEAEDMEDNDVACGIQELLPQAEF
jgi:hypothetical protein